MDPFSHSISVLFDPSQSASPAVKAAALAQLEEIKNSTTGWRMCLERLHACAPLHSYDLAQESDRADMRNSLMIFVRDKCTQYPQSYPIKVKLSFVLVSLVQRDYPHRWPTFFTDFIQIIQTAAGSVEVVDLFLKTLRVIDEEVVSFDQSRAHAEAARNTIIKDEMRVRCLPGVVECLFSILTHYHTTNPILVKDALETLKEYIGWIDISLIANPRFLSLFYSFLSSPALQAPAINCVEQIIRKRMPADKKINLIKQIQIFDILSKLSSLPAAAIGQEFAEEIASLIDSLGSELLNCLIIKNQRELSVTDSPTLGSANSRDLVASPLFQQQVASMVEAALALVYRFFESPNFEVSNETLEFLCFYVRLVTAHHASLIANPSFVSSTILRIFSGCVSGMAYPPWFDHNEPDDREVQYEAYHSELNKLFGALVKCQPAAMVDNVAARLRDTINNYKQRAPQYIEAALYCFHELPPCIKYDPATSSFIAFSSSSASSSSPVFSHSSVPKAVHGAPCDVEPFRGVLNELFLSELSSVNYGPAIVTYQEIVWRYSRIFESCPQLIGPVLSSLLDQRGVGNAFPKARSRACYALFQLLSKLPEGAKKPFRPFVDSCIVQIQTVIQPVLKHAGTIASNTLAAKAASDQGLLSLEDVNYLCQSLGMLIASPVTGDQCVHYGALVFEWFNQAFDQARESPAQLVADAEKSGHRLAALTDAVGGIVDAMSKDSSRIMDLCIDMFQRLVSVLLILPVHAIFRIRFITFVHTLIKVDHTGERLLPRLPQALDALLQHATTEDLKDFLTLINRMILKYKAAFSGLLNALFVPLCSKVFALLQATAHLSHSADASVVNTVEKSERLTVQRLYYSVLLAMAQTGLISSVHDHLGPSVLLPLLQSVISGFAHGDPGVEKAAVSIMFEWLKSCHEQGRLQDQQVRRFFFRDLTGSIYSSLFRPSFSLDDAQSFITFKEFLKLQRALCASGGPEYLNEFGEFAVSALGVNQEFVSALFALLARDGADLQLAQLIKAAKAQKSSQT